jgi:hypothetical protein
LRRSTSASCSWWSSSSRWRWRTRCRWDSGFGAARRHARLFALAGDTDTVYYRLLLAYCDWALALGAERGNAEIGTAATTERGRMNALGVISYVPIGYAPLAPGQSPAQRVPTLLRAECDLAVLRSAVTQILEPTP